MHFQANLERWPPGSLSCAQFFAHLLDADHEWSEVGDFASENYNNADEMRFKIESRPPSSGGSSRKSGSGLRRSRVQQSVRRAVVVHQLQTTLAVFFLTSSILHLHLRNCPIYKSTKTPTFRSQLTIEAAIRPASLIQLFKVRLFPRIDPARS